MKKIRKKIVMVGAFGVGKTSLVRRFVSNEFSEDYLSTIGVRIEKCVLEFGDIEIELMIWDLAGHDEFARLQPSYLRGASGVLLVADSTRAWTVHKALELKEQYQQHIPDAPWCHVLSKVDLPEDLALKEAISGTEFDGSEVVLTSAKTGDSVMEAFNQLASNMIGVEC